MNLTFRLSPPPPYPPSIVNNPPSAPSAGIMCLEKAAEIVREALKRIRVVRDTIVATQGAARALKRRRPSGSTSGGGTSG